MDLAELDDELRAFAEARDWLKFHTPKNLALALGGEVGELMEIFQWRTDDELVDFVSSPAGTQAVGDEIADVVIYAVRLAGALGLDLSDCIQRKLARNAERFPPKTT